MSPDRFDHILIQPASYDASLAFYRDALGWQVRYEWGGSGQPRGARLSSGTVAVVLAEDHASDDRSKSDGINGNRPTLHRIVEDVMARHEEVKNCGFALFAPQRTHWGTVWFVARDPDGNLVAFEQASGP